MATKHDYLADLAEHPNSAAGETAARLDASEPAVLEAFRRFRKQELVSGDGKRPEKFSLTDAGREELRVLGAEGAPGDLETKFSELEGKVKETVENVKGMSGLLNRLLGRKVDSRESVLLEEDTLKELQAENDALLEEKKALEAELDKRVRVLEFYATQTGIRISDTEGGARMLRARAERLTTQVDSEAAENVKSLVRLEEALQGEQGRFLGPRKQKLRELTEQIEQLREKLGFAPLEFRGERG